LQQKQSDTTPTTITSKDEKTENTNSKEELFKLGFYAESRSEFQESIP
jgi:hypothetical protein